MRSMKRPTRQKVIGGAAVAVLAIGGSIAAVSATGDSSSAPRPAARHARTRDLATAAAYLGVSTARLDGELSSGKTLAQVADSSGPGKSSQGLIEALEAARKAKLTHAESALAARVDAEVNRPGGPLGGAPLSPQARVSALFDSPRRLGQAAASYLGVSDATLESELRSGKTLAQLARASTGKSQAGIVDALLAAEGNAPAFARAARAHLTKQQAARRQKRLKRRAERLVRRSFAPARAAS